ncbi:hypothetical protein B1756_06325 [Natrarchaeobaculum aegyptiacum]|uniref:Uncharacterized protein n=1 Tax=Natrarchaeobaculum aegyptiacum TaxID=745377 RepID=A0A2Z2HQX3_9EURY|nr:hypothetical protein B1756_06325 [Natrarchaeobaculum aegyptiacum]
MATAVRPAGLEGANRWIRSYIVRIVSISYEKRWEPTECSLVAGSRPLSPDRTGSDTSRGRPVTRFGQADEGIIRNSRIRNACSRLGSTWQFAGCRHRKPRGRSIVATESQCAPDRTTAVRSVCKQFQLLL